MEYKQILKDVEQMNKSNKYNWNNWNKKKILIMYMLPTLVHYFLMHCIASPDILRQRRNFEISGLPTELSSLLIAWCQTYQTPHFLADWATRLKKTGKHVVMSSAGLKLGLGYGCRPPGVGCLQIEGIYVLKIPPKHCLIYDIMGKSPISRYIFWRFGT